MHVGSGFQQRCRHGPRRRQSSKAEVSSPSKELLPDSGVESRVNFWTAGGVREGGERGEGGRGCRVQVLQDQGGDTFRQPGGS